MGGGGRVVCLFMLHEQQKKKCYHTRAAVRALIFFSEFDRYIAKKNFNICCMTCINYSSSVGFLHQLGEVLLADVDGFVYCHTSWLAFYDFSFYFIIHV